MTDGSTELDRLWESAHEELRRELSGSAHRTWLEATRPVGFYDDTVVLAAPHGFAREQLDVRYGPALRRAVTRAAGRPLDVVVTIAPRGEAHRPPDAEDDQPAPVPQPAPQAAPETFPSPSGDHDTMLNPRYIFERFVIGDSNRFAHAAAFAVAEQPARSYNPLHIYGPAGLGKTHLLQAVGHYARNLYPQLRVRYVTSEQFTNEFIDAISNKRHGPFQRRYRDVDVLLIDDIQFLERAERTQEEFFHTFNALHNAQKQIVITSDRPPNQTGLEERLFTRFHWGLITDIQPPDLETRLAILRKKATQDGLAVPDEVLGLIAERISSNIRELEGAFTRVAAFASLNGGSPPSASIAQMILKDLLPESGSHRISVGLILAETANYNGYTIDELCGPSRTRPLTNSRQLAMYLTRELTDLSLPKIGEAFGGRDHTTVLHACKKIGALMGQRNEVWEQVQELTSRVKAAAKAPK